MSPVPLLLHAFRHLFVVGLSTGAYAETPLPPLVVTKANTRSTIHRRPAIEADSVHVYGLASGRRVSGAGLCELLLVHGGD